MLPVDLGVAKVFAMPGDVDLFKKIIEQPEVGRRHSFVRSNGQSYAMDDDLRRVTYVFQLRHDLVAQRDGISLDFGDGFESDLEIIDERKHAFKKVRVASLVRGTDRHGAARPLIDAACAQSGHLIGLSLRCNAEGNYRPIRGS